MHSLEGRTALVTGASRGIGLEIARQFSAAGAAVTLVGRDHQALEAAIAELPRANYLAGDVTQDDVIVQAVSKALEHGGRLDILINNAGGPPPNAPMTMIPMADFDAAIDLNLRSPLKFVQEAWRRSMREHGGAILNIASVGGLSLPRGMGAYATAKAGFLHMTRILAAELGPKIRVNSISPGVVETQATAAVNYDGYAQILPLSRVGRPPDIASAALFLVSDEASWITGENLTIDGGTLVQSGRLKPGWDV